MIEVGLLNRELSRLLSQQGHGDLLMVTDAGFAIPLDVNVVDLSLKENEPTVLQVLSVIKNFFSVERLILAEQTRQHNPTLYKNISGFFGEKPIETVDHSFLKEMSKKVKAIIRTGDFTAYGNVILVSGAGDRWYSEK